MSKNSNKAARRKKAWFAVKSLFRTEVTGQPRAIDEDYDPDGALVEERVILVRAVSHRRALRTAETEADKYCRPPKHVNPYGQQVVWRRVKVLCTFKLFEKPRDGREVWSLTSLMPSATTDQELEIHRFGPDDSKDTLRRRKKFFDRTFAGDVGLDSTGSDSA